ncbi:acetate--CoA ligase family protein [Lentzea flaviverrucosa]|uniref:Acyl-CoA synthetase (NDP forming) n=1 Tax=Lentzea flaviverrucosa TaxID=200379 RepID=A0A1H9FCF9_9PSEU|nr:acetate--CoA ligase family protein [Lentzea flaviverrucosa]RDI35236.1 acyl-CoA synthetase (NDP forming) [Lentzea flaviverrucosa]SEQ35620.1 Acyl-CoA synthetase (NDP forming) [Lentzea flaviverrucosa]
MIFSDPASVAVVGASDDPAKWGHWLARGALVGHDRRAVHLVNRGGGAVLGQPTVRSLSELAEAPELVVLAVPAAHVPAVVDEALAAGVRGFVGITSGIDDRVIRRIRAAGARLLGPNCLGVFDAATSLHLAWGRFQAGSLGVVSQSGQVGLEIAGLAASSGTGVSRFVSVGNQADVTATEALLDLVSHDLTTVVGVYLESFGPGTVAAMSELRAAGKPVVLLTVGTSVAAQEAARTHTGALTSPSDVVDAACRRAGAVRVTTPAALVDLAAVLTSGVPRGGRVGVVSDSGGQGAIAADLAVAAGLTMPALSVVDGLPAGASTRNPIDLAGAGEQDLANYSRAVEVLARGGEVDAVVLSGYFGSYGPDTPSLEESEVAVAARICSLARETGVTVVVHSMREDSAAVRALRTGGIPVQLTIERAVASLGHASKLGRSSLEVVPRTATAIPFRPGYLAARELLSFVEFPNAHAVTTTADVIATALKGPFALKADWLPHKSEHGGVRIGLTDPAAAFEEMRARLGPGTYVLEEMDTREHTVELIIGAKRDHSFGPVVLVGAGGVHAELFRDTAIELAPVTPATARDMLARLTCAPLLSGWRGAPAPDVAALAEVIAQVSETLAARPDLAEIELNPVRVGSDGVLAVDALIIPAERTVDHAWRDLPAAPIAGLRAPIGSPAVT